MNTLSLVIYLADISSEIQSYLPPFFIIFAVSLFLKFMITLNEKEDSPLRKTVNNGFTLVSKICVPYFILTLLLPSKNTILAIVASEMGETIVTSDVSKKSITYVESWLDKQIAELQDIPKDLNKK